VYKQSLQYSASFNLAVYGDFVAQTLWAYWVAKMNYLCNWWEVSGNPMYVFSDSEVGNV